MRHPDDAGRISRTPGFWLYHAWLPALLLAGATVVIIAGDLDRSIADALFFDRQTQAWIGANTWWAVDLIHTGGGLLVRAVGLAALLMLIAGLWSPRLRLIRRRAAFVALGLVLCTSLVGGLKQVTNVDCPRDLAGYGGNRPYVALFADRPDDLPRGRCFPGSHATSGFALMALYFALLGRRVRRARIALAAAIVLGAVFSIGQQARGAHFLSHDLVGAGIAWFVLLSLWHRLLESRSPATARLIPPAARVQRPEQVFPGGQCLDRRSAAHSTHARGRPAGLRGVFRQLLRPCLPFRAATVERRRRGNPGRCAGDARQGDAQDD